MEETRKYTTKDLKVVLSDVRMCTLLYCTNNNKVVSALAEGYIDYMNEFGRYCMPEKRNDWNEKIREIVYAPIVLKPNTEVSSELSKMVIAKDYAIIDSLFNFMNAAEIMKEYSETHSWERIDEIMEKQGHTGFTLSGLENIMLLYSNIGVEFVDRYDSSRIKRDKDFKEEYERIKISMIYRNVLNKRLINALSNKLK